MRRIGMILTLIMLCCNAMARHDADTLSIGATVSFVENRGQWAYPYRYQAQLHDAALFLEDGGITLAIRQHIQHPAPSSGIPHCHAYRMVFPGAEGASPTGIHPQEGYSNYYLQQEPSSWVSKVNSYNAVRYENLYQGIDFEIYGGNKRLKYNFIVHSGGDVGQVAIEYVGTDGVKVTSKGALLVRTSVRDIVEMAPYAYQENSNGDHVEVESRWRVSKTDDGYLARIEIGQYNPDQDLIIDPVLIFSTYTGSTADNWGTTAAYDSQRNVYTAGLVFDIGYPVSLGAYEEDFGGNCDVGIFKFDSSGSQRLYATYLGGANADMPHSLFVNSFDQLIVFGTTGSLNFPVTPDAYQTAHAGGNSIEYENADQISFPNGSDIFVSRFSSDGTQLQASTYVGGSGNDGLNYHQRYNNSYQIIMAGNDSLYYNYGDGARGEIITDNLNNVYIGSTTFSNDFPTTRGCVQPHSGGRQDGVVLKLDHNLRTLLWSSYLGGSKDDAVYSIDVDSAYNLLVCGGTNSINFPVTPGVLQPIYGGGSADGFVSKIAYGGERLMASTFLGSINYDQLYFVRTGHHNEVFLFGQSKNSGTTMIENAGYNIPNAGMLLVRMSPDLTSRRWSTLFGTPGRINLSPTAFAADICNRVYAAGWGRDFVGYNNVQWNTEGTTGMETTADAYSTTTDGQDFYIISIDATADNLEYATFFGELHGVNSNRGADHVDGGTSRFDRMATLYQSVCASCGGSNGFPTTAGAWSDSNMSSNCNNALFRFNVTDDFPVAEFLSPQAGCAPYTLQLTNTGRGSSFHWDFGDGNTSSERNPSHTYSSPGIYTITLIANQPGGCSDADTLQRTVQVITDQAFSHAPEIACNNSSLQIGNPPALGVTYLWSGDSVSDPTIANPWVNATGTYILQTTADGCTQTDTFHVRTYNLVDHWETTPISCHDSTDASVTFHLGSGIISDSITVSVNPPHPIDSLITASDGHLCFSLDSLAPEVTYHVSVYGYGCLYEQDIILPNPPTPRYEKEYTAALCTDSCAGSIHIRYNFSDVPEIQPLDTTINHLCPGTYITQLTSVGCPLTDTTTILRDHSIDSLHAWADRYYIYLGESVQLHASAEAPAEMNISYQWNPAGDLNRPDIPNPIATPSDTLVHYVVSAHNGTCSRNDTVTIHCTDVICGAPEFTIPNAFTPNGDGVNDRLCFNTEILSEFHIALFNRWGQCVYESNDAAQCWDGTFRNAPCLAGVYTYSCHIRCHNGTETDLKGDITLIR